MKELSIEARAENLHKVFDFVTQNLEASGCEKKTIRQCKLCVEEIFLNVSSYAYSPDVGSVCMTIDVIGEAYPVKVIFSFSDSGKPFDPLSNEAPDINAPLDERQIGGLGILLVTTTMDDVSYEYKGGRNILTLKKNIESKQPQVAK